VKKRFISAFILASTFSVSAVAADDSGWFIGAAAGQSDIDASGVTFDEDSSYKLLAGYDFTRHWAIGVEYVDLGDFDVETLLGAPLPAGVTSSLEADGFNFFGMFTYPVNDTFGVFAKAGLFYWDIEASASGPGGVARVDDDGTDFSLGLGAALNLTDNAAITIEFQRFDIDGDDVDTITGGITFRF